MKFFIILIIFAFLLAFVYLRLRPYIQAVRRIFGMIRNVQSVGASQAVSSPREAVETKKLLRCESCSTWIPASRALTLRTGAAFCSHECLENRSAAKNVERKFGSK